MDSQSKGRVVLFIAAGAVLCIAGCQGPGDQRQVGSDEDETMEPLAADSPAKAFEGTFRIAASDESKAARDAAIEDVVTEMSMLSRGIARGKLADSNPVAEEISFGGSGGKLRVTMDQREYVAAADGEIVKVKSITGDPMDMHFKIGGSELQQTFSGEGRGRVNTFRIDGDALILQVRVISPQLPKDLVYELTYKRV